MLEKRGRGLEVNHMHSAIIFHMLIITIIFKLRGGRVGVL